MPSSRVQKGSRLRLVINSPDSIFPEKNCNSDGVASETAKDARAAHVTLYHDPQQQSFIELPIVK
jgi:predicted acyl esterase